jgi:hypothetical protein
MMSLDDGAADGESDAHAVALRRVKSVKQLVHILAVETRASVPHGHAHTIAALPFGSDQQLPRAIVDADHRVRGVAEQVQNDLLELDAIASDRWEVIGELRLNDHPVSLKLTQRQRNDLLRGLVQIQRLQREFLFFE